MNQDIIIAIAADHAGFDLKEKFLNYFRQNQARYFDLGAFSQETVDYPDTAKALANFLEDNPKGMGILICGSGIGISMAANRYKHIRAALCRSLEDVRLARSHNDANVLVLGARSTAFGDARGMFNIFTTTAFEGGRHERRLHKLANLSKELNEVDPEIAKAIDLELNRQQESIELIASENIVSKAVLEAHGSILTNKYAEGYPRRRYYGGCEFVDIAEELAIERAKRLFGAQYVNVQPHSGSQANQAVFLALLQPGDKVLGMSLDSGGHLTHGASVNLSGKWFNVVHYNVSRDTGMIDLGDVRRLAIEHKPKLIIAGGSAYPRFIDFKGFREIANEIGAYLMVDMAHFAGLVAGGCFPNPIDQAHVVTTTTHKTLRGPRGGMVLSQNEDIAKKINSAIFPGLQGGPLMHVIAAKAVAFAEALRPEFKIYAKAVVDNAKVLADTLKVRGYKIFTDGTDSHLLLVDLRPQKLTGKVVEASLERARLTCNKNSIPFDTEKPTITSGIRLGSPAATSRGFGEQEFKEVGNMIADVLDGLQQFPNDNSPIEDSVRKRSLELCRKFPIYAT